MNTNNENKLNTQDASNKIVDSAYDKKRVGED